MICEFVKVKKNLPKQQKKELSKSVKEAVSGKLHRENRVDLDVL